MPDKRLGHSKLKCAQGNPSFRIVAIGLGVLGCACPETEKTVEIHRLSRLDPQRGFAQRLGAARLSWAVKLGREGKRAR